MLPILSGPIRGKNWIVGSLNHGCWAGIYERAVVTRFARSLEPWHTVYDIGANVGYYSLIAASRAREVFAFEPLPRNVALLRRHLELNRVDKVTVLPWAVGAEDGVGHFQETPSPAMGHLGATGFEVKLVRLDGLDLPPPAIIKMDIEGGEVDALEGASRTIERARPIIFLSIHGPVCEAGCKRVLAGLDYTWQSIAPDVWLAHPNRGKSGTLVHP